MFLTCTLDEALDRLASPKGTPGGGAAAALSASLGVALLMMVRPDDAALPGALVELKGCVEADIAAFDEFLAVRKDAALRGAALQKCIDVPARGAEIVLGVVPVARQLADTVPMKMLSDLGVAIAQLDAALVGLLLNVDINLVDINVETGGNVEALGLRNELAAEVFEGRQELNAAAARVSERLTRTWQISQSSTPLNS